MASSQLTFAAGLFVLAAAVLATQEPIECSSSLTAHGRAMAPPVTQEPEAGMPLTDGMSAEHWGITEEDSSLMLARSQAIQTALDRH